jgi:hypothetical protein
MNSIISSKKNQLLYAVILTLNVSVLTVAQISEKVVDSQSQINQKLRLPDTASPA